ncbi:MAG: type II toxin-antitoxin system VapB family antitoxin [Desulfovermiculus sp.]|nr:type II toxin-antitoxin system VapB family antitoxin [Desulfovermiculus sp.]
MALSIRNPRAEKLAREVAALSGESLTQAIIHALEDRLGELHNSPSQQDLVGEIMKISQQCSELPDADPRDVDEILGYNEDGVFDGY